MNQKETESLGTERIGKLLFQLALPAIAAQIINLLYNLVDRMYIGHMGKDGKLALTGVGVCLPLIMLISAFAALAGMGCAPLASIFLGKGEKKKAEKILGNSCAILILIALILTVVFQIFSRSLLMRFGGSENTIEYALSYMKIYSMGTLFVQITLGLNAFISAQGFSKISMYTVLIGAVCNIVLDPIFIFVLHMGVAGAALATIISQAVSTIWILIFLTGKKTTLRLHFKYMKLEKGIILPGIALGLSPFIMQATESAISICFNSSLLKYGGDLAVGAMTILTSVMQFSMLPLHGLTQGAQPIVSYNYGAGNTVRVKKTFKLLLTSCLVYSTVLWVAVQLFPGFFVQIFNNDPQLLIYTSRALRIYMGVTCVFGAQIACQQTFISIGNARSSLFLALLRKVILLIPLIYILPFFIQDKEIAVFLAEPVADILAVTATVTLFTIQFKKVLRRLEEGKGISGGETE